MIKDEKTRTAEHEFFAKQFQMSYSGLNKLVFSPALFYKHYVLNQREEEMSPALLNGKVIHCLLLDDGSFNNQFILLPGTMPGDNTKKVIHKVFEKCQEGDVMSTDLKQYPDEIVAMLAEMNLHQALTDDKKADKDGVQRTGDQKRVDKIVTPESQEYFEFLFMKGERDVVDIPTMEYCTEIVEQLRADEKVMYMLGMGDVPEHVQSMNEIMIESDEVSNIGFPFGLRGILDNVKIDHEAKIIYVNDLKTTSKSIADFPETVDFWNLWMQAAMYKKLVTQEFLVNNKLDPSEWKIEFAFIVVDKYKQVYPFKVTDQTMANWELQLEIKLSEAKWHFENQRFDLPYIYATTEVKL
jgi:hypothetical protein